MSRIFLGLIPLGLVQTRTSRRRISTSFWALLIALVGLIGAVSPKSSQLLLTNALTLLIGVLALQIFSGNSGILSFGHVGFVGVSAYTTGILSMTPIVKKTSLSNLPESLQQFSLPFPLAMLAGVFVATLVGVLSGLVISRLRDSATIASVGILIIVHSTLIGAEDFTRGSQTFFGVKRFTTVPVAATVAILALIVARWFRDSKTGIHLRASRDDVIAASSAGVRIQQSQFKAWVLSAAIAGAMGSCYAGLLGAFSPKDFYFTMTLTLLTMLIVGGSGSVAGAVVGVILVMAVIESLRRIGDSIGLFGLTNAGLALIILLTLYLRPKGVMRFHEPEEVAAYQGAAPTVSGEYKIASSLAHDQKVLSATKISKSFSGLRALDNASIYVERGKISGLIGPNGSGKSTMVNCITGVTKADNAEILLDTKLFKREKTWQRARAGLGRTFQNIRLFRELTAVDNVVVACISSGESVKSADKTALNLLNQVGVLQHAYRFAGELSFGDQRRVEIARALALRPSVVLLDEPAAGMNPAESAELLAQFRQIMRDTNVGMLLIDHDVTLIKSACDFLTVLDHGAVIAHGKPDEVLALPEVHAAYLGWGEESSTDEDRT
jgi:branched-chain amino acid transport system permease protein